MIILSIPESKLAKYDLDEDSTKRRWLTAVEPKLAYLKVGDRAKRERVLAIVSGKIGHPAKIMAIALVHLTPEGRLMLLSTERLPNEDELRGTIQKANLKVTRNPVQYLDTETPDRYCACGCGIKVWRDFASGHDQRALQARIQEYFGGSVLTAINELDRVFGGKEIE